MSTEDNPTWLTHEYLSNLLDIKEEFELTQIEYACAKGENFASKIYRAILTFKSNNDARQESIVLKSRPIESGFGGEFVSKFSVFPKEITMYGVIEELENIYQINGYHIKFAPKCIKVTKSPIDVIVLEDLCAKGYRMARKCQGLVKEEISLALHKLAQFHAASAVYYEKSGRKFDKTLSHKRGIYGTYGNNKDMIEMFEMTYDQSFLFLINEIFSNWPSLDKSIIDKMKNWRNYVLTELIRSMAPSKNGFNCLLHGDAWLANILFKYASDGKLEDCRFIDFQQSVFTSPVIDLMHLIFTSAHADTKLENIEYYVKVYHSHLIDMLRDLEYPSEIPTLKSLQMEMLDRGFYAVWQCFIVLPVNMMDDSVINSGTESSSANLVGEDDDAKMYKRKLYGNDRYRQHMTELLHYFNNRGLMDLC